MNRSCGGGDIDGEIDSRPKGAQSSTSSFSCSLCRERRISAPRFPLDDASRFLQGLCDIDNLSGVLPEYRESSAGAFRTTSIDPSEETLYSSFSTGKSTALLSLLSLALVV